MGLGSATSPAFISIIIVMIGVFGVVSALFARKGIGDERIALKKGRDALNDLPVDNIPDYLGWLGERQLTNTHFADHLLAAWDAKRSGRSVSLHELHEVSARHEARRRSARLSGGVAGLLLVCGIAGTLLCIKPILGNFNVNASPDGVFEAAESAQMATLLMQELSRGFLPSLWALVLTVIVACCRGFYTHDRGVLAGELDRFDLEDLFPRFPPPSLSKEFDEVRASIDSLVTKMLASQNNFDGFVERIEGAAQNFRDQAPPLQDASARFVGAVETLEPKIDELLTGLKGHLGAEAPLCKQLGCLDALAHQVTTIAEDMKQTGTMMTDQLNSSRKILQKTAKGLPAQLKEACVSATMVLKEATTDAVSAACTDAVKTLEDVAVPVRNAAAAINAADQELRNDISNAIDKIAADTREQTEIMKKEFQEELKSTVRDMKIIQATTNKAISDVGATIQKLEEMQVTAKQALGEYVHGRKETAQVRMDVQFATAQAEKIGQQLQETTTKLITSQKASSTIAERLSGIVSNIDRLSRSSHDLKTEISELKNTQRTVTEQFNEVVGRAENTVGNWKAVLSDMDKLSLAGATLSSNLSQFLSKGHELANLLKQRAAEATQHQQVLNDEFVRLSQKKESNWMGRVFRDGR